MSYLTTKNQYITVDGNKIAYRELSKGKSKLPLLMLVLWQQPSTTGIQNSWT